MNTWIPTKFYSYSKSLLKVTVRFIHNIFYEINIPYLYKLWNYIGFDWTQFPKLLQKYTTFQNFIATSSALQNWRAAQFLTTSNKFSLQHLLNDKWYRLFFEGCLKIPKILPGSQIDTFVTLLKLICCLLFSKIKAWGISKLDLTIQYLKEWMLVNNGKSFQV